MGSAKFDYHYGSEAESYAFYAFPKVLFSDTRYSGLSIAAKFLYSLMLDAFAEQEQQGGDTHTYTRFDLTIARRVLKLPDAKLLALFKELDTQDGIGLIDWHKQLESDQPIISIRRNAVI